MTLAPPAPAGPLAPGPAAPAVPAGDLDALGTAFEAAFLSEMLQAAGFAAPREGMGGGAGEAQFAPMLARAVAEAVARERPLGIGEALAARLAARGVGGEGA